MENTDQKSEQPQSQLCQTQSMFSILQQKDLQIEQLQASLQEQQQKIANFEYLLQKSTAELRKRTDELAALKQVSARNPALQSEQNAESSMGNTQTAKNTKNNSSGNEQLIVELQSQLQQSDEIIRKANETIKQLEQEKQQSEKIKNKVVKYKQLKPKLKQLEERNDQLLKQINSLNAIEQENSILSQQLQAALEKINSLQRNSDLENNEIMQQLEESLKQCQNDILKERSENAQKEEIFQKQMQQLNLEITQKSQIIKEKEQVINELQIQNLQNQQLTSKIQLNQFSTQHFRQGFFSSATQSPVNHNKSTVRQSVDVLDFQNRKSYQPTFRKTYAKTGVCEQEYYMVNVENIALGKLMHTNILLEELDLYYEKSLFTDLVISNLSRNEEGYLQMQQSTMFQTEKQIEDIQNQQGMMEQEGLKRINEQKMQNYELRKFINDILNINKIMNDELNEASECIKQLKGQNSQLQDQLKQSIEVEGKRIASNSMLQKEIFQQIATLAEFKCQKVDNSKALANEIQKSLSDIEQSFENVLDKQCSGYKNLNPQKKIQQLINIIQEFQLQIEHLAQEKKMLSQQLVETENSLKKTLSSNNSSGAYQQEIQALKEQLKGQYLQSLEIQDVQTKQIDVLEQHYKGVANQVQEKNAQISNLQTEISKQRELIDQQNGKLLTKENEINEIGKQLTFIKQQSKGKLNSQLLSTLDSSALNATCQIKSDSIENLFNRTCKSKENLHTANQIPLSTVQLNQIIKDQSCEHLNNSQEIQSTNFDQYKQKVQLTFQHRIKDLEIILKYIMQKIKAPSGQKSQSEFQQLNLTRQQLQKVLKKNPNLNNYLNEFDQIITQLIQSSNSDKSSSNIGQCSALSLEN